MYARTRHGTVYCMLFYNSLAIAITLLSILLLALAIGGWVFSIHFISIALFGLINHHWCCLNGLRASKFCWFRFSFSATKLFMFKIKLNGWVDGWIDVCLMCCIKQIRLCFNSKNSLFSFREKYIVCTKHGYFQTKRKTLMIYYNGEWEISCMQFVIIYFDVVREKCLFNSL